MRAIAETPSFIPETEQSSPLVAEASYLRNNWQQENLSKDWRHLDGIGFHTRTHVDMLYNSIDGVLDLAVKKERVSEWLTQTEQDIKGFNLEYLAQGLTFPIYYKQEIIDNQKRIVAPLYGNKLVVDLTSEQERDGVVKDALAKKVEPYLLYASEGSIAVMTSPSGWSGLRMENGDEIVYPDSQTYIWQKRGDEVVGFTIRTDFSLAEHKAFLKSRFGLALHPDATVTDYVSAVGLLNGRDNPGLTIKDVVDSMRDARLEESGGSLLAYKNRLWKEVYRDLDNSDALWQFDTTTQQLVDEFTEFIDTGSWTRQEVEETLAVTILRVARHIRGDIILQKEREKKGYGGFKAPYGSPPSYGAVFKDAQELEGCAGGGTSSSPFRSEMREVLRQASPMRLLIQSVTPRYAELGNSTDDGLGPRDVECPESACGKINERPFGGYILKCKHCGSGKIYC